MLYLTEGKCKNWASASHFHQAVVLPTFTRVAQEKNGEDCLLARLKIQSELGPRQGVLTPISVSFPSALGEKMGGINGVKLLIWSFFVT